MTEPTYTFDPTLADDVSRLRSELGDSLLGQGRGVKPGGANLSDEELESWLAQSQDSDAPVLRAAVRACEALARAWASAHDITSGPRSESFSQTAKAWGDRAAELQKRLDAVVVRSALAWPP